MLMPFLGASSSAGQTFCWRICAPHTFSLIRLRSCTSLITFHVDLSRSLVHRAFGSAIFSGSIKKMFPSLFPSSSAPPSAPASTAISIFSASPCSIHYHHRLSLPMSPVIISVPTSFLVLSSHLLVIPVHLLHLQYLQRLHHLFIHTMLCFFHILSASSSYSTESSTSSVVLHRPHIFLLLLLLAHLLRSRFR